MNVMCSSLFYGDMYTVHVVYLKQYIRSAICYLTNALINFLAKSLGVYLQKRRGALKFGLMNTKTVTLIRISGEFGLRLNRAKITNHFTSS